MKHYEKSIFCNEITDDFKSYLIDIIGYHHRKFLWIDQERLEYSFDNTVKDMLDNWKDFNNTCNIYTYYANEIKKLITIYDSQYLNFKRLKLINKILNDN